MRKTPTFHEIYGPRLVVSRQNQTHFQSKSKKEIADIVKPTNDVFIQLTSMEQRLELFCLFSGEPQPQEDIHEFNAKILKCTREKLKRNSLLGSIIPTKRT